MLFKFFLSLLFCPVFICAMAGYHEPWGKDADLLQPPPKETEIIHRSLPVRVAEKVIRFHQNILSPVDGPRSHFRPSSSQYMLLAMRKRGFITGFLMGCDRLLRENEDDWVYPKIEEDGKLIKYDPPR